jgi:glycosyltransferase involved in cell wall biosynthesis
MIPLVSVIIPVYNKAPSVGRTIKSVRDQDLSEIEIIIVNDGSTDDSEEEILTAIEGDDRCRYISQSNAGVANARNLGVLSVSSGKFIVCLDSDDAIEPGYLRLLVNPMIEDESISITYTALKFITPDGKTGISNWPGTFNADAQMAGKNQIPTAAMTRRKVWERLGGQRHRFSPVGAGAEDADFWLRAVSYGFRAKYIQAEKNSLFVYSFMSGLVSGNKDYREPDYRLWSPWARDPSLMPTASIVETPRGSHPARQYDQPLVSIIIPVGPGHAHHLVNALDSLDAQTFKQWEAIIVFDIQLDEWLELRHSGHLRYIARTWPFCRFMSTHGDTKTAREIVDMLDVAEGSIHLLDGLPAGQPRGAGVARNIGIARSRAPLLMFLDADDSLVPTALRSMMDAYKKHRNIIYSDHIAVAKIKKEDLGTVDGKVVGFNERSGDAYIQQTVADYNCPKALEQPYTDGRPPYIVCNVSALVPKKWMAQIGNFDEKMKSWEDVLTFWRLAWAGYCFTRIPEPLLVYRYYTGHRRELGKKHAAPLLKYLAKISERTVKMGCKCKEGKSPKVTEAAQTGGAKGNEVMSRLRLSRGLMLEIGDSDLVLAEFNPPDAGDKTRYGFHDFGQGNVIIYGRFDKGSQFYVHRKDLEADRNIAKSQGREPMFTIIGPTRDVIEEEHVVEELSPPSDVAEIEWLKSEEPEKVEALEPIVVDPPPDNTLFHGAYEEEKAIDADNYFPTAANSPGRMTDIANLDLKELKSPDRYITILQNNKIYTAWDVVKYEEKYVPKGLSRLDGIGPKTRRVFADAARKVI